MTAYAISDSDRRPLPARLRQARNGMDPHRARYLRGRRAHRFGRDVIHGNRRLGYFPEPEAHAPPLRGR
jgi:hypothetical protein